MMLFINNYNFYINFLSLISEFLFVWCFIIFIIYVCFYYFNKIFIYEQPLICLFLFSFFIFLFFIIEEISVLSSIFGGCFLIFFSDLIIRNIIVILSLCILLLFIFDSSNSYGLVFSVEYFILIYILILSSILLLYCNDIISLFLFIELQSMTIYILICLKYDFTSLSIGMRYFMIGTIVSLLFIFGFTLIYYISGISNFLDFIFIEYFMYNNIYYISVLMIYSLFMLKLYLFPFHFIGCDLYRNSPLYILFFISSILYFIYIYIFMKIFLYYIDINNVIFFISVITFIFGSLNVILQRDIRSFLGFGTSIHSSLLVIMIFMDYSVNYYVCLFYSILYILSIIGILLCFLKFRYIELRKLNISINNFFTVNILSSSSLIRISFIDFKFMESISLWSGLFVHYRHIVIIFSILLWSIAGLPPFSGFFTKFCILAVCLVYNYLAVFIVILILSIFSSLYYIKILKELYYSSSLWCNYNLSNNMDYLFFILLLYICIIGIFIPEFVIYIFY